MNQPARHIPSFASTIQSLIAQDRVQEAIDASLDWIRENSCDNAPLYEVIVISCTHRQLQTRNRQGIISYEEYQLYYRQLIFRLLELIGEVAE